MENRDIVPKVLMAPLYHLELVKDRELPYDGNARTTEAAAQVLHTLLDRSPTEVFAVLYLNSDANIIGAERVGMGGMESVETVPTEIFRGALVAAAPEVVLCHNHPTGNVQPSPQDLMMTMQTLSMGGMLGLRVRDHIIVGPNGKHMSIRENMHNLHAEMDRAEEMMFGGSMKTIKDKLSSILGHRKNGLPEIDNFGGLISTDTPKKGGDPKANLVSDWKDSLSYLWLTR